MPPDGTGLLKENGQECSRYQPTPRKCRQRGRIQIRGEGAQLPSWSMPWLRHDEFPLHLLNGFRMLNAGTGGGPVRRFVVVGTTRCTLTQLTVQVRLARLSRINTWSGIARIVTVLEGNLIVPNNSLRPLREPRVCPPYEGILVLDRAGD